MNLNPTLELPSQTAPQAKIASREIHLASRPQGLPTAANFTLVETELELLREQQVLVRNLFIYFDNVAGESLDHAVGAFLGLFEGKNIGKMVVKLD